MIYMATNSTQKTVKLETSALRVEVVDDLDRFMEYSEAVDALFIVMYGRDYPYMSEKVFDSIGPDSRAICIWYNDLLVGYLGFIQDKYDNKMDFGRLVKHPEYVYSLTVMGDELNMVLNEIHKDHSRLFYGTTRLWISSFYLEMYTFQITGSMVHPLFLPCPWGEMGYHYFGMYVLPKEQRLAHTMKLPPWVTEFVPSWQPVFEGYDFGAPLSELALEPSYEDFGPEKGRTSIDGRMAFIPCVQDDRLIERVRAMLEDGWVCMSFLPAWKRANKEDNERYVNFLLFQKREVTFRRYPTEFPLSPIHYEFTRKYHCDESMIHLFYGKSFHELFGERNMEVSRRMLLWFYQHFCEAKVYNLFYETHDITESAEHIFR